MSRKQEWSNINNNNNNNNNSNNNNNNSNNNVFKAFCHASILVLSTGEDSVKDLTCRIWCVPTLEDLQVFSTAHYIIIAYLLFNHKFCHTSLSN